MLCGDEQVLLDERLDRLKLVGHLHLDRRLEGCALELGHLAGHGRTKEVCVSVPRDHHKDLCVRGWGTEGGERSRIMGRGWREKKDKEAEMGDDEREV